MPVQDALDFFHLVRQRPDVQERLATWGPAPSLSQLVDLADELGFGFSPAELHAAFRQDWTMRWLHHASSESSTVPSCGEEDCADERLASEVLPARHGVPDRRR